MTKSAAPTTADLVVLSLLREQPMHGHHLNRELQRREIRDWAAISRAQIYYSLDKLHREGWVEPVEDEEPAAGPERQRYRTSRSGRAVLARGLDDERWALGRERPVFLTWLALSMHARPGVAERLIARRRAFVEAELVRERATLEAINADTEPIVPAAYFDSTRVRAVLMVELMIEYFETELGWLRSVGVRLGCA